MFGKYDKSIKDLIKYEEFELKSNLLERKVPFGVIFPANYKSTDELKVLYLLHGLFGRFDNWIENTNIFEYARQITFAVVCVEGGDNWYSDSSEIKNHFFESYILDELIPFVEEKFGIGKTRERRAIAGLSMGGYGAFKMALRRPEMFCFAASMSGAFHAAEIFNNSTNKNWLELLPSISKVFGDDESNVRSNNDLFKLIENYPPEKLERLPYFYFDCGLEDSFLPENIRLAQVFQNKGISHQFEIFSGGHNWDYWNIQIRNILARAEKRFSSA